MDSKNYTQVLIDGKIYTLGGSEDEGYLQRVAVYVNEKLNIMRKLPGFTRQSSEYQNAMIQLNIADDYFKSMEQEKAARRQRDDMERESYSLKHELVGVQMKLEAVLKDLEERQRQIEETSREKNRLERRLKEAERSLARQEVLLQAAAAREQEDRQALAEARKAAAFQQGFPAFKEAAAGRESQMRVVKSAEDAGAGDEEPAGESARAGLVVIPGRSPETPRRAETAGNAGGEVVRLGMGKRETVEAAGRSGLAEAAAQTELSEEPESAGGVKENESVQAEAGEEKLEENAGEESLESSEEEAELVRVEGKTVESAENGVPGGQGEACGELLQDGAAAEPEETVEVAAQAELSGEPEAAGDAKEEEGVQAETGEEKLEKSAGEESLGSSEKEAGLVRIEDKTVESVENGVPGGQEEACAEGLQNSAAGNPGETVEVAAQAELSGEPEVAGDAKEEESVRSGNKPMETQTASELEKASAQPHPAAAAKHTNEETGQASSMKSAESPWEAVFQPAQAQTIGNAPKPDLPGGQAARPGHGGKQSYSSKEELTRKALLAAMAARNMNHRKR